jgi:hypothetical protein
VGAGRVLSFDNRFSNPQWPTLSAAVKYQSIF